MIIKNKTTFEDYDLVLNMCDLMIKDEKWNTYINKSEPQKLKDKFLDYAYIYYLDEGTDTVCINFTQAEMQEYYYLLGFAYCIKVYSDNLENQTDYVAYLKEKYAKYQEEKRLRSKPSE